jgi:hypothetical protein
MPRFRACIAWVLRQQRAAYARGDVECQRFRNARMITVAMTRTASPAKMMV